MPSSRQFLEEGLDPTIPDCVSLADLVQMFRASLPASDIGYIISAEETALPNIVTYPEVARFLVRGLSAGVPTGRIYYYNGSSWQLIYANLYIADGSLEVIKLDPGVGNALKIIRVNVAGDAFEFSGLIDAFSSGSFPISKLDPINAFAGALVTNGTAISWESYASLWTHVFDNAVPDGVNRDVLFIDGTYLNFGSINTILPNNSLEWRKMRFQTNIIPIAAGVIVIDASLSGNFKVSLTGNVTTVTLSNMTDGMTIQILFKQDAVGGRTVDFTAANINWIGGVAPTITVTAEFGDVISISMFDGQLVGAFAQNAPLT